MKKPTFSYIVGGISYTNEDLRDPSFEEYRKTNEFIRKVVAVKIHKFGPETKWTKRHDYITTGYFISDQKITESDIVFILKKWSNVYPGIYNYELVKENILDFVI